MIKLYTTVYNLIKYVFSLDKIIYNEAKLHQLLSSFIKNYTKLCRMDEKFQVPFDQIVYNWIQFDQICWMDEKFQVPFDQIVYSWIQFDQIMF